MTRKPPKRVDLAPKLALTMERLVDLRKIITDPGYALGPQDEADLVDALEELIDMRIVQEGAPVVLPAEGVAA